MIKSHQIAVRAAWIGGPVLLALSLFSLTIPTTTLTARWTGDSLQVSASNLHFLTGNALARLRNATSVPFDFQLTVLGSNHTDTLQRSLERFVVSYDLWEERFKVVRMRNFRQSAANLTATAAEAWCLDNIAIPAVAIPTDKPLWVRLEIRSSETKMAAAIPEEGGISLTALIDMFSRPPRNQQEHWTFETGPLRIGDVRREHAPAAQ